MVRLNMVGTPLLDSAHRVLPSLRQVTLREVSLDIQQAHRYSSGTVEIRERSGVIERLDSFVKLPPESERARRAMRMSRPTKLPTSAAIKAALSAVSST